MIKIRLIEDAREKGDFYAIGLQMKGERRVVMKDWLSIMLKEGAYREESWVRKTGKNCTFFLKAGSFVVNSDGSTGQAGGSVEFAVVDVIVSIGAANWLLPFLTKSLTDADGFSQLVDFALSTTTAYRTITRI